MTLKQRHMQLAPRGFQAISIAIIICFFFHLQTVATKFEGKRECDIGKKIEKSEKATVILL